MGKNTEENKAPVSPELQQLADLLNSLPADDGPARADGPEPRGEQLRESSGAGISEQDILQQLLSENRDEPEIRRRLQQDFVKNGGKLDKI